MTNNVFILEALSEDVPGILSVRRITWLTTYPNEKYGISISDINEHFDKKDIDDLDKYTERIKEDKSAHTWVARFHSKVIGYISAGKGDKHNSIRALYILSDYQNIGIGKQLMDTAFKWLGNNKKITLEVVTYNERAISFYKKLGFMENGPTTCEAGNLSNGKYLPEIEMVKIPTKIS